MRVMRTKRVRVIKEMKLGTRIQAQSSGWRWQSSRGSCSGAVESGGGVMSGTGGDDAGWWVVVVVAKRSSQEVLEDHTAEVVGRGGGVGIVQSRRRSFGER